MSNSEKIPAAKGRKKRPDLRKMTVTAVLAAAAAVLQLLEFSVPLMPLFIKLDFSELPALIAAFAFGPLSGVAVCLIKNLVKLFTTTTGGVGELANFLLGCAFVVPAGLVYKHKKTRGRAFTGALLGSLCMAVFSLFANYYVVYPIYGQIMPLDKILAAYRAILPSVKNLWHALLIFNLPFTFLKGLCSVAVAFLIYKPLSPVLKGRKNI